MKRSSRWRLRRKRWHILNRADIEHKRAVHTLRLGEDHFRRLVENGTVVFWTADADGEAIYVSPNVTWILGYDAQELIDAGPELWMECVHPHDLGGVLRAYGELFRSDTPLELEFRFRHKDGHWIWIHDRAITTYERDGLRYTDGVLADVTALRQAEEALRRSEERLRTIFDTMSQGAIYRDAAGIITTANRAAERILGIPLEDMRGRTLEDLGWEFVRPDDTDLLVMEHPAHVALRSGEAVRNVIMGVVNRTENRRRWIDCSAVPVFSPESSVPAEVYTIFEDVTSVVDLSRDLGKALEREKQSSLLLQRALLPQHLKVGPGYVLGAAYIPAFAEREVGGDLYDAFPTADGGHAIMIGDVSGKGLEAASLAAICRSTVRAFAYERCGPAAALTRANEVLYAHDLEAFATVFLACVTAAGRLHYAAAGHLPPAILRATGEVDFLPLSDGQLPLGVVPGEAYSESEAWLHPGDTLVLYTDGISEARRGRALFGEEGIAGALRGQAGRPPSELIERVLSQARSFSTDGLRDDAALLVVAREPVASVMEQPGEAPFASTGQQPQRERLSREQPRGEEQPASADPAGRDEVGAL